MFLRFTVVDLCEGVMIAASTAHRSTTILPILLTILVLMLKRMAIQTIVIVCGDCCLAWMHLWSLSLPVTMAFGICQTVITLVVCCGRCDGYEYYGCCA